MSGDIYVVKSGMGTCRICEQRRDLRCGCCFKCSDQVAGRVVARGIGTDKVHELWDSKNPSNKWYFNDVSTDIDHSGLKP